MKIRRYRHPVQPLQEGQPTTTYTSLYKFIEKLFETDAHGADVLMRDNNYRITTHLPPRTWDDTVNLSTFYQIGDFMGYTPRFDHNQYVGKLSKIEFPNLLFFLLAELHREGKVADTIGLLANQLLRAKGSCNYSRHPGTLLLELYGEHYENVYGLVNQMNTRVRTLSNMLDWTKTGIVAYADLYGDHWAHSVVLVVRGDADETYERMTRVRMPVHFYISDYRGVDFRYKPDVLYYDESGRKVDGIADSSPDFENAIFAHTRREKLKLLIE